MRVRIQKSTEPGRELGDTALARERAEYVQLLDRAVTLAKASLSALPEVRLVVLFGSYAAGRRDLLTDLDLLVVMESRQNFVQRSANLRSRLKLRVDCDLLVYTPEEFARLRNDGFVRHALETGKVLYAKEP